MKNQKLLPMIYIVDDEFSVRDSLTLLLESTGLTVISFDSGETFLENYDPDSPGCLILDIRMPLMSGHELQSALLDRGLSIPIIFISGNAEVSDSIKAFRVGAFDFLEKPIISNELLARVNDALKVDSEHREKAKKKLQIQKHIDHLTAREKEVLGLIVESHSNKEAAKMLNISNRTIEAHRCRIMDKMGAENVIDLLKMVMCAESEFEV